MKFIRLSWLLLLFTGLAKAEENTASIYAQDFEFFWQTVAQDYAYFDLKQTDWDKAKVTYSDEVAKVTKNAEFISLLEKAIDEFYDAHLHLNSNTEQSPPLIPSSTDVWAKWENDIVYLVQVRPGSAAAKAGLRAGHRIMAINGVTIEEAMAKRIGRHQRGPDAERMSWAATAALAGMRDLPREFLIQANGVARNVSVPVLSNPLSKTPLTFKRIDDLAYIRFENSLGNSNLIAHFDSTLNLLRDSKGLIIDLRNTPSGGNSTVARAILSRFADHDMPYQKHVLPSEEKESGIKRSWFELVSPRGSFVYRAPVVVLVDHWTGSMGEGLAIGMNAVCNAPLIGTEMAKLLGATEQFKLPNTRIGFNLPVEKLQHINGTPREQIIPTVRLPDTASDEEFVDMAVSTLRRLQRGEAPNASGSQR